MIDKSDWERALLVQDACNLSGVVHSFSLMLTKLWDEAHELGRGTEWVNRHPISVLYSNKIAQLSGSEIGSVFEESYYKAKDITEND